MIIASCPLCADVGGTLVFKGEKFRVIRADEPGFPAFYRVVWTEHVAEFSDLGPDDRSLCMAAVVAVELALREQVQPTKINLAALGNMVPHLHWHVIARFDWDSHFPAPVWAAAVRPQNTEALTGVTARLAQADLAIKSALATLCRGV
jgi:diadenosine tetraphosphate (Ap4A) HIT family hydrolase